MRGPSVSSGRAARAWQAAISACRVYPPRPRPRPAQLPGPVQGGQAAPEQGPVPPPPVLVAQQDRLAVAPGAGRQPGRLQLHQREQAVHLGLAGQQAGQQAAEPHRSPHRSGRAQSSPAVAAYPSLKIR